MGEEEVWSRKGDIKLVKGIYGGGKSIFMCA